jgi:Pin2-interacting protein X1
MASQGWKPGEYLGATGALHAELHTVANASHIRVMIKDDNLGIGAKIGSGVGHGECTGLDAFKNLLGRLNGKEEEELQKEQKEQKSRDDLKRAIYAEKRWGSMRFVKGGFLVGDKIQQLIDGEAERVHKLAAGDAGPSSNSKDWSDSSNSDIEHEPVADNRRNSKKRKLEKQDNVPESVAGKVRKSKRRKLEDREGTPDSISVKVKRSKKKCTSDPSPEVVAEISSAQEGVKASKKKSKRERSTEAEPENQVLTEEKKRKREKKNKKDKRTKNRDSKSEAEKDSKDSMKKSKRDRKKSDPEPAESIQSITNESTASAPLRAEPGRSTPIILQGRHAIRARNIAQKRLASMDVASLNQVSISRIQQLKKFNMTQIFMIKP